MMCGRRDVPRYILHFLLPGIFFRRLRGGKICNTVGEVCEIVEVAIIRIIHCTEKTEEAFVQVFLV
jgi:hypothetical protein